MRRLGLFAAWLGATLTAVLLTTGAVQLVAGSVSDRPSAVRAGGGGPVPDAPSITPESTASPSASTSVPGPVVSSSTTTIASAPTTSELASGSPPPSSTTTIPTATTPPPADLQTFHLLGGQVTTACQGDDISLLATAPNVGFEMEIEDEGPEVVEVDFESTTHRSRFKAECVDGQINEEIREEPED